ncbi:hypothetical protein PR202_ga21330 [Eleusine coracana subsp. coracana]|uniref:Uncharacterized protein n=1 Tax=Eleusine coracana subsp. coracana TaxID=191504 RepID=A0AAV5D0Q5_ELECO|nr:hypothetical protein PR202_ga21330 [Eleusine coracana subsp. coracana]
MRTGLPKQTRKGLDSLFLLTGWQIWKARNDKVFNNNDATPMTIVESIKAEVKLWMAAGAKALGSLVSRE